MATAPLVEAAPAIRTAPTVGLEWNRRHRRDDANPPPEPEEEPPCCRKEEPETEPPTYHISQRVIEFSYLGPTLGPTERRATLYVRGDGLGSFSQYGDVTTTPWHGGFLLGPGGDATLNYEYRGYYPYMSVHLFNAWAHMEWSLGHRAVE